MKNITSLDNPLIKQVASLTTPKGRSSHGLFIAEGLRTCQTLAKSPLALSSFFVTMQTLTQAEAFVPKENLIVVSDKIMHKIAPTKTPSGFLGVFYMPTHKTPERFAPGLVLYNISDPGNMGTLIRSAVAFDRPQIILVGGADPWNPKTIQASAGTIGYASVIEIDWNRLKNSPNHPPLCALVAHDGEKTDQVSPQDLIVVGGEAHGIPPEIVATCDKHVTLQMPGHAESLNAAVAGSIALYLSILP